MIIGCIPAVPLDSSQKTLQLAYSRPLGLLIRDHPWRRSDHPPGSGSPCDPDELLSQNTMEPLRVNCIHVNCSGAPLDLVPSPDLGAEGVPTIFDVFYLLFQWLSKGWGLDYWERQLCIVCWPLHGCISWDTWNRLGISFPVLGLICNSLFCLKCVHDMAPG